AVYAVSVYGPGRARLVVVGTAIVMVVSAVALLLLNDFDTSRKLLPPGVVTLIAWVIGDYIRSRRTFFGELVARHQKEREQAAEEERLRIARELHDVVAHNVSAMAIQAGAARVSGSSSAEALESIEAGARATLAELNRLLGVLRKSPGAPLAPQPALDEAGADALLVTISDNGTGGNSTESTGHGLIGMHERVELFGGEMKTGSSSLGGFTVRAKLPLKS